MMSCLCVGGKCAGQCTEVIDSVYAEHLWRVKRHLPINMGLFGNEAIHNTLNLEEALYRVTYMRYDEWEMYFLRHDGMSVDDALKRVADVIHEFTNMRLPSDWSKWTPNDFVKAFRLYSELGDPYAPD